MSRIKVIVPSVSPLVSFLSFLISIYYNYIFMVPMVTSLFSLLFTTLASMCTSACEVGMFKMDSGNGTCQSCPPRSEAPSTGSTSCSCKLGYANDSAPACDSESTFPPPHTYTHVHVHVHVLLLYTLPYCIVVVLRSLSWHCKLLCFTIQV